MSSSAELLAWTSVPQIVEASSDDRRSSSNGTSTIGSSPESSSEEKEKDSRSSDSTSPPASLHSPDKAVGEKRKVEDTESFSPADADKQNDPKHARQDEETEGRARRGGGKTSDRRREQNRQAQRAFRERKEKHTRELEDKVSNLEGQLKDQADENVNLKDLISHLQKENEKLKVFEAAFTFDFPKNGGSSSAMPLAPSFSNGTSQRNNAGARTSPSSVMNDLNNTLGISSTQGPSPFSLFGSALTGSPQTNPSSTSTPSDNVFSSPSFDIFPTGTQNGTSNPMDANSLDPFTGWREPSVSSPSRSATGNSNGAATTSNGIDFAGLFDPFPVGDFWSGLGTSSSASSSAPVAPSTPSRSSPSITGIAGSKHPSTSAILEPEASSLKANGGCAILSQVKALGGHAAGFEFDLDELCSDMKKKASCQERARRALEASLQSDRDIWAGVGGSKA